MVIIVNNYFAMQKCTYKNGAVKCILCRVVCIKAYNVYFATKYNIILLKH